MTDHQDALQDVASLIQERRRYEGWLAAIETRRDSTPGHVFARVQADYRARIDRVGERLAGHRSSLSDALAGLQSRLGLLDAEEQLKRDERAEVDLRAHVGELSEADVADALRSIDEGIAKLGAEKAALRAEVERVSEFFAIANASGSLPVVDAAPRPPVIEPTKPAEAGKPEPEKIAEPEPEKPVEPEPERTEKPAAERKTEKLEPRGLDAKEVAFDEMGFLTSVMGEQPTAGPESSKAGEFARDSMMPRAENSKRPELLSVPLVEDRSIDAPFAANVTANTPIKLRASGQLEQPKTLKCSECGGLNYPTEWYCERCGAELAAL